MVTIKQIAEKAGVSTATVSNVIHGKVNKVSPAMVETVKRLIDEMGYIQPMGLSVLHKGNSRLVACVVNYHLDFKDSFLSDPFYGKVVGAVEEELRKAGYYMLLHADRDVDSIFKMAMTWNVDGIIAVSMSDISCEKLANMTKKPVVSIDYYTLGREDMHTVPNIGLNDVQGGEIMVEYMLQQGYESIYVCDATGMGVDRARWKGAERAFFKNEADKKGARLIKMDIGNDVESRASRFEQILKQVPFKRRTCFFFLSDFMAMEAIHFFNKHGISIPKDFGVAGFDDNFEMIRLLSPALTTIHQDFGEKGRLAAREMIKGLENNEYEIKSISLPVSLIVRESI